MTNPEEVRPTEPEHDHSAELSTAGISVARGADAVPASAPSTPGDLADRIAQAMWAALRDGTVRAPLEMQSYVRALAESVAARVYLASPAPSTEPDLSEFDELLETFASFVRDGASVLHTRPAEAALRSYVLEAVRTAAVVFDDGTLEETLEEAHDALREIAEITDCPDGGNLVEHIRGQYASPSPAPSAPDLSEFDRLLLDAKNAAVYYASEPDLQDAYWAALRSYVAELSTDYNRLADERLQPLRDAFARGKSEPSALVASAREHVDINTSGSSAWIAGAKIALRELADALESWQALAAERQDVITEMEQDFGVSLAAAGSALADLDSRLALATADTADPCECGHTVRQHFRLGCDALVRPDGHVRCACRRRLMLGPSRAEGA